MKIAILSMQRINNMGSLLQAYALKRTIEGFGHEVEFIDIRKNEDDNSLLEGFKLNYKQEEEKASRIRKYFQHPIKRFQIKKKLPLQNALFDSFRRDKLEIDKKSESYDICVIGSDEVFNCLNAGWWGFTSQLFGNVVEAKRVITYAASCGATSFRMLPSGVRDRIRDSFKAVAGFSVRDSNTYEFCKAFGVGDVKINLDPVLVYDFDKEIESMELKKDFRQCCIIYSYKNRINDPNEIKLIIEFCKRNKLTPIAIGAPQFWCKDYIVCSPLECLKIFKAARFVITDTFHGTIFAVKYAPNFAVMSRESNANKLNDLVSRLEVSEHLIEDFSTLDSVYAKQISKDITEDIIKTETENTKTYLLRYL